MEKMYSFPSQPNVFFFLSALPTSNQLITPIFPTVFPDHTSFYRNSLEDDQVLDFEKKSGKQTDQANEVSIYEENYKNVKKIIEKQDESKQIQEYLPKKRTAKDKTKRVYQKDKERNILPNTMSKLFFFLKSINKSQDILIRILAHHRNLATYISPSRYYVYQNFLKTKLGRYLSMESLKQMFRIVDTSFQIFSLHEQLAFIKVNTILLRNFFKTHIYYLALASSPRIPKNKIESYLSYSRKILEKAREYLEQTENLYDFSIFKQNSSQ